MTASDTRLTRMVEDYLTDLRKIRASGGATGELSYYPPLTNLLNAVGGTLRPKVFAISGLAAQGAGHPDFGLYSGRQIQKGRPREGQSPERGVIEVKSAGDDAWLTADSGQVSKYWERYRLVLVTNTRDFVLLGEDASGKPAKLETFRLADSAEAFEGRLGKPRAFAREAGAGLGEYLSRALSHRATLVEPKDVAWLLASYARDGLARVEAAGHEPSLHAVRAALEDALGVRFEGERGAAFFRSSLVQTLFYGMFSAWVLWSRQTPPVVRYMVARVDRALKDDLGIADGLAADHVYVLDPCCGTGAYLGEVLRRIDANLRAQGSGALTGARVKRAAMERVFGFEIMPAPFVVAHLQVGLTMQALDAPLSDEGDERASVFLTNALTGWEPTTQKPLPFPELEEERDRADRVKQDTPVLVILGNPPYNGFAGMAVDEERELSTAYRTTQQVRRPEGQGLNDLYVRFFRMAERRIAEKTGRGVVCFISNYSWLDGLSFTGMRERYLEAFDVIRIDSLNGDKYKTGKTTPDGQPDPSIFSSPEDPVGIQVGTAITTLVRKADHEPAEAIGFRQLWGQAKRDELTATADAEPDALYEAVEPLLALGLPFAQIAVSDRWSDWPALPDLFQVAFSGVKTARDGFLVDIDRERLNARVTNYFNAGLSHEEVARRHPIAMQTAPRFDPRPVRDALLARGGPAESGFVRYAYRPFDTRWLYWDADTKLLDEKRVDYQPHVFKENLWLSSSHRIRKGASEPQTAFTRHIASYHLIERVANWFPAYLRDEGLRLGGDGSGRRPNLSDAAQRYLDRLGLGVEDLFHHVLTTLHDPAYREANAGALRMEWPRIPLPGWPDGDPDGAADELQASAARGRELAALLDVDTPVPGVTTGALRAELAAIGVPTTVDGHNMDGDNFAVTAGWGHFGSGEAVMPGQGRADERPLTADERSSLGDAVATLGETTFDIHLNDRACWRNVPAAVWNYKLGGYQVLKKWLSYREHQVLDRPLRAEEVQHFADTARRIAAILLLTGS